MKKAPGFFMLAVLGFCAPAMSLRAQSTFEGTVTWSMSIPQLDEEKHEMVTNIKGEKSASVMDMGAQGMMKTWVDREKKKMYIYVMGQGMTMDMPDEKGDAKDEAIEIKPTGEKATVAGHPAEEYLVHGSKGDMSVWEASDFPKDVQAAFQRIAGQGSGGDKNISAAFRKLAAKGLVPVRIVAKNAGEVQMSMDFVKYEPKKLDDALFVLPTDVKFNPMPKGMGGMN